MIDVSDLSADEVRCVRKLIEFLKTERITVQPLVSDEQYAEIEAALGKEKAAPFVDAMRSMVAANEWLALVHALYKAMASRLKYGSEA